MELSSLVQPSGRPRRRFWELPVDPVASEHILRGMPTPTPLFPLVSAEPSGGRRPRVEALLRALEYRRRALGAAQAAHPGYARYAGRVGALAVALGVGSAVASMLDIATG